MWQGLLIRIPSPIVRLPLRNISLGSTKSKGNDEKVVNKQCNMINFKMSKLRQPKFLLLTFLNKVMDQSALSRKVDPQEAAMKKAADELARFDPAPQK